MKYVVEFRDLDRAQGLLREIHGRIGRHRRTPLGIMEVCGGHTHTIFRYGLNRLLPEELEFIHGPGCPVCVLPRGRVDDCVALAQRPEVIMTTFGDAMRVTGSRKSLLQAMRRHPAGRASAIIGEVKETPAGAVVMRSAFGGLRVADMLVGDQLPRIC